MHFTREIIVHPSILTSPTLDPWVAHFNGVSMTILLNGEFPPPALFSQSESLIQTLTLTLRSSPSRGWKRGRGTGGQRAKKGGGRTPASQWFWQQKINVGDAFPPTTFTILMWLKGSINGDEVSRGWMKCDTILHVLLLLLLQGQ